MLRQPELFRKFEEQFYLDVGGRLHRSMLVESESESVAFDASVSLNYISAGDDLKGAWWTAYLAGAMPVSANPRPDLPPIRIADLFCGIGGLSLGVHQFFAETGRTTTTELAVDMDSKAVEIYAANHETASVSSVSVADLVDAGAVPEVDLVVAGPPCQGYSALNVHTLFADPKNDLYRKTVEFAIASNCRGVIIENVPNAIHDENDVVSVSRRMLHDAGYRTSLGVWHADRMGWPQTRARLFMIGCRNATPFAHDLVAKTLADASPRSVTWAFNQPMTPTPILHTGPKMGAANMRRINWLFDNDKYDDIPVELLPPSNQDPDSSFNGNYCRLHPDRPSGTMITSFTTLKAGRTIHPTERRTLIPAEGAVLQGFPATYEYVANADKPPSRTNIVKWIGNAVPMPLGYAAGLAVSPEFLR